MTVTAPPRPPRPSDPVNREEVEALVEALIEEARQRARRRRRRNGAVVTLVALVGVAVFAVLGRSAQSQSTSSVVSARSSVPAAAATSQIAFMRDYDSGHGEGHKELYVMNADGSGQRLLARDAWMDIAWSPDGREIAFLGGGIENEGFYVVKADGSGQRRLTRNAAGLRIWPGRPMGRRSPSAGRRGGHWDVYVMNADRSGVRKLTRSAADEHWVTWSPDGRKIAFVRSGRTSTS